MYLEGCEPFLGCTIILSGASMEELKIVKKAFQKMITIARVLVLEKDYLNFIQSSRASFNKTPFLVKKHLERDYIVLQLVQYSKKKLNDEESSFEEEQKQ